MMSLIKVGRKGKQDNKGTKTPILQSCVLFFSVTKNDKSGLHTITLYLTVNLVFVFLN